MSYTAIACELHDYLEVSCIRKYRLYIELMNHSTVEAIASDLITRSDKTEWLQLEDSPLQPFIRLDQIYAITPLPDQPGCFGRIIINERS